jgi:chorismate dehydratase
VPYLNSVAFFRGWPQANGDELTDCVPRELGARASAGQLAAGPLPIIEYFRQEAVFERLGHFGIAVRGRARSALLFARQPIRQLDGATVSVSEETSTTVCLLRLLLERRYRVVPAEYRRGRELDVDALLLIGDDALRFRQTNTHYPYEVDLAFEWWLWQHLPFVFAVWAIRKDAGEEAHRHVELGLARSLGVNLRQLEAIAGEQAPRFGMTPEAIHLYLSSFVYRLGQPEEAGIARFRELVDEHGLL